VIEARADITSRMSVADRLGLRHCDSSTMGSNGYGASTDSSGFRS
jgi:hypothetical protein